MWLTFSSGVKRKAGLSMGGKVRVSMSPLFSQDEVCQLDCEQASRVRR